MPPPAGISGVSLVAADDRRETRAGARRLLGGDVSAASLRVERPARAAIGPLQGDRRAAARAVRRRPRSRRRRRTCSPSGGQLGDRHDRELRTLEGGFAQDRRRRCRPATSIPEARQRLAALGYVGSFVASASDPRTGRADPKDKIALFNKLGRSHGAVEGPRARAGVVVRQDHRPAQRDRARRSGGHRRVVHAGHAVPGARRASRRRSSTTSGRSR